MVRGLPSVVPSESRYIVVGTTSIAPKSVQQETPRRAAPSDADNDACVYACLGGYRQEAGPREGGFHGTFCSGQAFRNDSRKCSVGAGHAVCSQESPAGCKSHVAFRTGRHYTKINTELKAADCDYHRESFSCRTAIWTLRLCREPSCSSFF